MGFDSIKNFQVYFIKALGHGLFHVKSQSKFTYINVAVLMRYEENFLNYQRVYKVIL
jgi:hypothetical protein